MVPGGIDPHTHLSFPFMGQVSHESFLRYKRCNVVILIMRMHRCRVNSAAVGRVQPWLVVPPCTSTLHCQLMATWRQAFNGMTKSLSLLSWTTATMSPSQNGMKRSVSCLCLRAWTTFLIGTICFVSQTNRIAHVFMKPVSAQNKII